MKIIIVIQSEMFFSFYVPSLGAKPLVVRCIQRQKAKEFLLELRGGGCLQDIIRSINKSEGKKQETENRTQGRARSPKKNAEAREREEVEEGGHV